MIGLGWEAPWLIANNDELIKPGIAFSMETMAVITRCPDKPWLQLERALPVVSFTAASSSQLRSPMGRDLPVTPKT